MVRLDFIQGGFPISRRSPVLCVILDGEVVPAYNHFDLKKVIEEKKILKCFGVWPGKKTTDIFILNPDAYCDFSLPEKFKDIDSALQITAFMDHDYFDRIEYKPGPHEHDQRLHITKNESVYRYMVNIGLRFKRSFL